MYNLYIIQRCYIRSLSFYCLNALVILMLFCLSSFTQATEVRGNIASNTTWTTTENPYIVSDDIMVESWVTLTVNPGVIVKFDSGKWMQVSGTLIACGTSSEPIVFTSNSSTPTAGDWGHIRFTDSSIDAVFDTNGNYIGGSILQYCQITYGGGGSVRGAVQIENSSPFIDNCDIHHNASAGISADYATGLRINRSNIHDNTNSGSETGCGIRVYGGTVNITDNTIINNNCTSGNEAAGGVAICGDFNVTVTGNTISHNICDPGGGAGGLYAFGSGPLMIVNNTISDNTLDAKDNGAGGCFVGAAVIRDNIITGNNGGTGNDCAGGVSISSGVLDNNIITDNIGNGVFSLFVGSVTITNNTISNNTKMGISTSPDRFDNTNMVITGNTISDNMTGGIELYHVNGELKQNTISGNGGSRTIYINTSNWVVNNNSIHDNSSTYTLYYDGANTTTLDATNNWWGTTDIPMIQSKIWDHNDDLNKGIVNYQPILNASPSGGNTFTITASAGANGSIDPAGVVSVNYGADQSFTIIPNVNYDIADVLVDGKSVGPVASYTFSNVITDYTISAIFVIDNTIQIQALCQVDLAVTGTQGRISKDNRITEWGNYTETDLDNDGVKDDKLIIFNASDGSYTIEVIPEPNATGTYTLQVLHGDLQDNPPSITIVENELIQDIPSDGYSLSYTSNNNIVTISPTVKQIITAKDPVAVKYQINANATFTDPDILDAHTATWNWGDGSTSIGTVSETSGSRSVDGSHIYTVAGVYTVKLTVTDKYGGSGQSAFQYVVIYDPSSGFVTGGGWINSPAGAYTPDPTLTGKANFGFVSKYQKGANVPTGNTEFNFKVANMNFHSTVYEWLVIAGAKAKYKGSGTINGSGDYQFMLSAIDGQINGGGGIDRFRIKIWDKASGGVVYDNQKGDADDVDATDAIEGGSIVIHKDDKPAAPESVPLDTCLLASYPNPANPEVWIPYRLNSDSNVVIRIYDSVGRLVRTLDLGSKSVGYYVSRDKSAYWDGNNESGEKIASGIYFYNIKAGNFVATKKLVIAK